MNGLKKLLGYMFSSFIIFVIVVLGAIEFVFVWAMHIKLLVLFDTGKLFDWRNQWDFYLWYLLSLAILLFVVALIRMDIDSERSKE